MQKVIETLRKYATGQASGSSLMILIQESDYIITPFNLQQTKGLN